MMVCFSTRHTKFGCADIQVNPMLQLVMPVNNFPKVVENKKNISEFGCCQATGFCQVDANLAVSLWNFRALL